MSLEERLGELVTALERNTAAHEAVVNMLSTAKGGTTDASTTAAPAAATPSKRGPGRPKKAEAPTEEQVVEATEGFIAVEDEDDREARREAVRNIFAHADIKVKRLKELPAEKRAKFLEMLNKVKEEFDSGGDAGADDLI